MRRLLIVAMLMMGSAVLAGCGAGESGGTTERAPSAPGAARPDTGAYAGFEDVRYIAYEKVSFDRLPRERLERAGEARIEAAARRVPAFRIKDNPKRALRYTEDGRDGWLAWQPEAVLYARRELSRQEKAAVAAIQTLDITSETWDACLGVPGNSCDGDAVPGFKVLMRLSGKVYEYHTDQSERAVRAGS